MNRRRFLTLSASALAALGSMPAYNVEAKNIKNGTKNNMNILVLSGSPRKNGNSNELAKQFIKGAEEAGHQVNRIDAAEKDIHPCIACNSCGMDGPCIFKDDFQEVREKIIPADLVAFVSPLYYFGISAQLKALIDRFYAINGQIHVPKKAVFLLTFANSGMKNADAVLAHYDALLDYLGWQDAGRVIAPGVWTAGSIKHTDYPKKAYDLGKNL